MTDAFTSEMFKLQPDFWRTWFLVLEAFDGDDRAAREWFATANPHLNNQAPSELAQTAEGARGVQELLQWIEVVK